MSVLKSIQELLLQKKKEIDAKKAEINAVYKKIEDMKMSIVEIEKRLVIDQEWYDSLVVASGGEPLAEETSPQPGKFSGMSIKDMILDTLKTEESGMSAEDVFNFLTSEMVDVKLDSIAKTMSNLKSQGVLERVGASRPAVYKISSEDMTPGEETSLDEVDETSEEDILEDDHGFSDPEESPSEDYSQEVSSDQDEDSEGDVAEEDSDAEDASYESMSGMISDDAFPDEDAEDLMASLRQAKEAI